MAELEVKLSAEIAEFKKNLKVAQGEIDKFATDAGNRLKSVGDAIKSVAIPAGVASAAITAMGLMAVKSYGRLQSLEKGLEAVSGSSEAAKQQLEDLREVAKLPGLGLEEAVKGSISLQAIGISADDAKEAILQFGNAVATVGKGRAELDRALYGLQQLANTDLPLGEDLNIIKDAIPQVSKLLDEAFGANRSDELAKMGVSSQQVIDVIIKGLSDLPRVAGGVENAIENMQDGITEAWQEMGKAINDALDVEGVMNKVGDALGGVVEWFRNLSPAARDAIVYITAAVAGFGALLAALGAVIAIAPIVFSSITLMTGGIAAVTAAVAVAAIAIINNWESISMAIQEHNVRVLYNLSRFTQALADLAQAMGLTNYYTTLKQAQIGLSLSSKNLFENIQRTKKELFEKSNAAYADIAASRLMTEEQNKVTTSIDGSTEAIKRMSAQIWSLNGLIALNGKEFKRNPLTPTIGAMDRGTQLDIGAVNIEGIVSASEIAAIEAAEAFNEAFNATIGRGIAGAISDFASGIGTALASGGNLIDAMGQSLLGALGGILTQMGEMAIQVGVGLLGIKLALKSLNPFVAIAAGVALVAIGSAFSSGARNLSNSIAGQGSSSNFQDTTTGTIIEPRSQQAGMELVLRGGDLYRMNKQYESKLGYGG